MEAGVMYSKSPLIVVGARAQHLFSRGFIMNTGGMSDQTCHMPSFNTEMQIRPGHYTRSQSFGPLEQAGYWDCKYPDEVGRSPH